MYFFINGTRYATYCNNMTNIMFLIKYKNNTKTNRVLSNLKYLYTAVIAYTQ